MARNLPTGSPNNDNMTTTTMTTSLLMTMMAKEDNGGDNKHNITINSVMAMGGGAQFTGGP